MKKKSIKKWILGLCSALMLSLVVGFSLPKTEAKALSADEYNIYDYSWANYFNGDALWENCDMVDDSSLSDYPVLRVSNSSHVARDSIKIGTDIFGSNGCLSKCLPDVVYTLKYNFSFVNVDSSFNAGLGLALHDTTTGSTVDFWGHYYQDYLISIPSGHVIDLYVILNDNTDTELSPIPEFAVINFIELAVYRGTSVNYDYTPYFYSLESLPDDGGSGDSGSGDSGSDTPDVPDVPDVPIVNGSYQEGYLAGLAQAQYGVFSLASFKLHIANEGEHDISESFDITPSLIYGGVDFTSVYNDYYQNYPNISYWTIIIRFSKSIPLSSLRFYAIGDSSIFTYRQESTNLLLPRVWYLSNNSIPLTEGLSWQNSNIWGSLDLAETYQTVSSSSTVLVDQIQTTFNSSISFLNGFRIYMFDNQYSAGYEQGFSDVNTGLYDSGYNDGYDTGHRIGYDSGYNKGSRDGNSWLGLFTAVIDAPVNVFSNLLNFDVLGFNMKNLFLSLLTVALVVAILRLFAKGDSTS